MLPMWAVSGGDSAAGDTGSSGTKSTPGEILAAREPPLNEPRSVTPRAPVGGAVGWGTAPLKRDPEVPPAPTPD
jgi:hypothetical protein